jgi:hypothetical protein
MYIQLAQSILLRCQKFLLLSSSIGSSCGTSINSLLGGNDNHSSCRRIIVAVIVQKSCSRRRRLVFDSFFSSSGCCWLPLWFLFLSPPSQRLWSFAVPNSDKFPVMISPSCYRNNRRLIPVRASSVTVLESLCLLE